MRARRCALLAVVVVAAACGGEPDVARPTPTPPPVETPTHTPTELPETSTVQVDVFFSNEQRGDPCGEVFPVTRTVAGESPVAAALDALLEGPTATEQEEGYGGWFTTATAGMLRDVEVADGTAWVDFADLRPVIPNASTSCGSAALLSQLDRTVLQFPDVDAAVYAIDGDPRTFYHWLQLAVPPAVDGEGGPPATP